MVTMFPRALRPPRASFFLFGPRGTGKSTWIRTHFERAYVVNLLPSDTMLRYERDPALFRAEVLARPTTEWIVVDEVQRVPKLLDEVHFLMEERGYKRFALTGSSARKVKRGAVESACRSGDPEKALSADERRDGVLRPDASAPPLRVDADQRHRRG